jgi:hypothetical protein
VIGIRDSPRLQSARRGSRSQISGRNGNLRSVLIATTALILPVSCSSHATASPKTDAQLCGQSAWGDGLAAVLLFAQTSPTLRDADRVVRLVDFPDESPPTAVGVACQAGAVRFVVGFQRAGWDAAASVKVITASSSRTGWCTQSRSADEVKKEHAAGLCAL